MSDDGTVERPRSTAAEPMFFASAWLLMIFAAIVGTDVGIRPFGYVTSMVVKPGTQPPAAVD